MKKRISKLITAVLGIVLAGSISFSAPSYMPGAVVHSASDNEAQYRNEDPTRIANTNDREQAYIRIMEHIKSLRALYDLSPEAEARIQSVFYQGNVYIANTTMTLGELDAYVSELNSRLSTAATTNIAGANQFLYLDSTTPVSTVFYGYDSAVNIAVVNLGKALIQDVVITPVLDSDVKKWPFVIDRVSDARRIESLQPAYTMAEAAVLKRELSWPLQVSKDAPSGTYPITFHARYYRNGVIEDADLLTFVHVVGNPAAGKLGEEKKQSEEEEGKTGTPRIIVTGFKTEPEQVFAGDTFKLTVTVQNTAESTAVSNIQFDFKAASEGDDNKNTFEAFLPTSGSATIFVNKIEAGATTDLEIEMTARSDLTQKPYVIDLHAAYEDSKHNPYTASTSVSVPVHQEARVDTGDSEVLPEAISVGGSSNVMFPIYNKGKTTLYNVSVSFEADSIAPATSFIGKLEPGATGNVDVMLNGVMPTEDDGTIVAVISYEDEAANVTTLEKPVNLYVMEMDYSDMGMDDYGIEEDMMEEEKKFPVIPVVGGGVAGLAVIGTIIGVAVSKSKKKKALQAELDSMDEG
ncbi:MAG: hypothetical protein IKI75_03545 [Lachnospiraceae bacterium]|nr:hypothetical protein [Lachnospiraceae bacterium]